MPSQITHLVIAKKYLAKNQGLPSAIRDVKRFLDGTVLPDLDKNKSRSHYGVRTERTDMLKRNAEKVNPQKFLQTHDLSDDLDKGQYLHLYVDYQYYNVFLHDYYATSVGMDEDSNNMYQTTRRDDQYLIDRYHVAYDDTAYGAELREINAKWDREIAQRYGKNCPGRIPYSLPELESFIEAMASVKLPKG